MTHPSTTVPASAVPAPRVPIDAGTVVDHDHPPEVTQGDRSWRRSFVAALIVWVAARLAYAILTVLNRQLSPGSGSLLQTWFQWDGWHFFRIAEGGYDTSPQAIAFFPLFPVLVNGVDAVLPGGFLIAALVVSNACTYGALVLLHRLATTEFDVPTADRTIYLLAVFPTAYFLAAPYNHSLFLVFTLGCLYAIRRESWWLAGALGALASATRSTGVLLVLPFAYEYLRRREFQFRRVGLNATAVALIPTGLAAFAVYCWSKYGDPLAFSHAQSFWNRRLDWPGHALWSAAGQLGERSLAENYHLLGDLAATLFGLAMLIACLWGPWALRRDQWYLVMFAAPAVLMPLLFPTDAANPLLSTARLLLDMAVLFVILARVGRHVWVERSYVFVALALHFGYLLMFLRGAWTF